ncbi:MAG: N-acetyltransferase [Candidatus Bathyarchaeota archaeon]|nr:GNAT family N-acetyltransferase [Candidatus Bathyarchaeota archaeon A05DMB-5]MDH7558497.1 N-acetyltransferase [Candidatus Bathyarchaeota archaeon]
MNKRKKSIKKPKSNIEIRQMTLEDVPSVWHLGEKTFTPSSLQYTYRTWNTDELLSLFSNDPELCLVAEHTKTNKIVGFALGTILKRPFSPWTYGYFVWAGVQKRFQKTGVGRRLYRELEKRFKEKGARIVMVDVESNNPAGICFIKKLGFKEAQTYIWYSKNLEQ